MEKTSVQKLARVLKVLVTITFVCNLLVLPLVPGLVGIYTSVERWQGLGALAGEMGGTSPLVFRECAAFFAVCWQELFRVWREPYTGVLAGFLMACGACTAVILWQARRVLVTIKSGNPFQAVNGRSMTTAAVCFFLISAAALVRLVWRIWYFKSLASICSYNALFVPLFAMGGLLCLGMSALFRQAFELKAENGLTI